MAEERLRLWAQAHEVVERYRDSLDHEGNCYETAFRIVMDGDVPDREARGWRLVHALVEGGGSRHGHAWVEIEGWAVDFANGHQAVVEAAKYREVGKASDIMEYEWHKAAAAAVRAENFGPWHHDGGPEPLGEVDDEA